MPQSLTLRYGQEELPLRLPAGCEPCVIRKPSMPLIADPLAAIYSALEDRPLDCPSLSRLASTAQRVCIVICDITRPVPNGPILRAIVDRLERAGVSREQITILIATGLHRPNLDAEMLEVVGDPWIYKHVRIENHFARVSHCLTHLGHTPSDRIPVVLNRRLVEADLRIVVGLVEPHFMAGYSGGRKVIAPGVAGEETIRTFHSFRFMASPAATNTNLDGNPLHRGQLEILDMLGPVYAVNVVIDEARQLSHVNFGECAASHLASVQFVRRYAEVPVAEKFPTVVTSTAGYPLDRTYYQTVKAMVAPLPILQSGGRLIVASRCQEGFGSPEFRAAQTLLTTSGSQAFLEQISRQPLAEIDAWQSQMLVRALQVGRVALYSTGLSPADERLTGVEMITSIEQAIADSIGQSGNPKVAVIPEGPYVIPLYRPDAEFSSTG